MNEIEASRYVLESAEDTAILGRPLLECAIIRFHQQRKYVLDSLRLLFEIDGLDTEEMDQDVVSVIQAYISENVWTRSGQNKLNSRCMSAMGDVRSWLARIGDKMTAAAVLMGGSGGNKPDGLETLEFSRVSLVQQHELLSIILSKIIEKKDAEPLDFRNFLQLLQKWEKYDILLGK